jgi:hypothetical protein
MSDGEEITIEREIVACVAIDNFANDGNVTVTKSTLMYAKSPEWVLGPAAKVVMIALDDIFRVLVTQEDLQIDCPTHLPHYRQHP